MLDVNKYLIFIIYIIIIFLLLFCVIIYIIKIKRKDHQQRLVFPEDKSLQINPMRIKQEKIMRMI